MYIYIKRERDVYIYIYKVLFSFQECFLSSVEVKHEDNIPATGMDETCECSTDRSQQDKAITSGQCAQQEWEVPHL